MDTPPDSIVIDSHHHVWDPTKRDYPWLTDPKIARPFGVDDLRPLLEESGIDATVLVQTVGEIGETREFLGLAAETPFIYGVVGWADLTDPQLSYTLDELKAGPGGEFLAGIRHQVHDEADENWLGREDVQQGLGTIAEAGLVYDLLIRPQHLDEALRTAQDFPHLRFVIDHMAKPDIANGEFDGWNAKMHEFAGLENVACKLSGILTEAGADWSAEALHPYVRTVVDVFGPHRLMFGSDWPVSVRVADYATVYRTFREAIEGFELPEDDVDAIFGRTAVHWYGLERNLEAAE